METFLIVFTQQNLDLTLEIPKNKQTPSPEKPQSQRPVPPNTIKNQQQPETHPTTPKKTNPLLPAAPPKPNKPSQTNGDKKAEN